MNGPGSIRSRIAPTPSGLLHLGNGVNFAVTWTLVRAAGGILRLRIDDADSGRTRPEFVEDVFRQLDWLGIDWDEGPSGVDDFFRNHSQLLRRGRYLEFLSALRRAGAVYPCSCSRREIRAAAANGLYPGTCRSGVRRGGPFALRLRVADNAAVKVDGVAVPLARRMGDFVLWRKDDLPAYQLASLADDIDGGINLIVRGEDLVESSAAQLYLASLLGGEGAGFAAARFVHHPLVRGRDGEKLAKSKGSLTLAAMRAAGAAPAVVWGHAARFLGLAAEVADGPSLLAAWQSRESEAGSQ